MRQGCLTLWLAALSLGGGCASPGISDADLGTLRDRKAALEKAVQDRDADAFYMLQPPSVRQSMSLEDLRAKMKAQSDSGADPSPKLGPGKLTHHCACVAVSGGNRCVFIGTLTVDNEPKEILEVWQQIDGEWYRIWLEPLARPGSCPAGSPAPFKLGVRRNVVQRPA